MLPLEPYNLEDGLDLVGKVQGGSSEQEVIAWGWANRVFQRGVLG